MYGNARTAEIEDKYAEDCVNNWNSIWPFCYAHIVN